MQIEIIATSSFAPIAITRLHAEMQMKTDIKTIIKVDLRGVSVMVYIIIIYILISACVLLWIILQFNTS